MAEKIRILFLALNDKDSTSRLRFGREVREIEEKIRIGASRDYFSLTSEWIVRRSDLQQSLLKHKPHIIHFTGRGIERGVSLEDKNGNRRSVSPDFLRAVFEILSDEISCVVLNSCFSNSQAQAIAESVPCVVGTSKDLQDEVAVSFFASFYQALAYGRSIQEAYELGNLQVKLEGRDESSNPVLLLNQEVDAQGIYPVQISKSDSRIKEAKDNLVIQPPRTLRVFLCHSSDDKQFVRELYSRLRAENVDPWLDEKKLIPGQDWQTEIQKAVRTSDIILVCLSKGAINRKGFIHKEIKYALDVADEQPEGTIFLIPLRLDECDMPERLRRWHWVNYFDEDGYERLLLALRVRAGTLGLTIGQSH
jgi:hypothetical protein